VAQRKARLQDASLEHVAPYLAFKTV
jgi:hypothetical protein